MTDNSQGTITEEGASTSIPNETKPAETTDPKLPDGVAERTAVEFEKLKEHNKQLKEKLSQYEQPRTSVLDDLTPKAETPVISTPNLSPSEVKEIKSRFVDENGYVDVSRLETALNEADNRAKQAELKAQQAEERITKFEESEEVKIAHSKYPHLNPSDPSFDPKFYDLVKNELIGQMMKGKKNIMEAAKKASELYSPKVDVSQAREEAVNEYKTKVSKRNQATESSTSTSSRAPTDREELIRRTQAGDRDALFKRLQASGN